MKLQLSTPQQILFFRELDFPLIEIKEIMTNPHYDKKEALAKHKELLIQKRRRLDGLIMLLDNTLKGDNTMSFKEFDMTEMKASKDKYAAKVKEHWSETSAYKESVKKVSLYDDTQWKILNGEGPEILKSFGENRINLPNSEQAQKLIARWQSYISNTRKGQQCLWQRQLKFTVQIL